MLANRYIQTNLFLFSLCIFFAACNHLPNRETAYQYYYQGKTQVDSLNYIGAVHSFMEAEAYAPADCDSLLGYIYREIAQIMCISEEETASRPYFEQAQAHFRAAGMPVHANFILLNFGDTYYFTQQYDSARSYYEAYLRTQPDSTFRGIALYKLSAYWESINQYDTALQCLQESLRMPRHGNSYSVTTLYMAGLYKSLQMPDSAIKYATLSLTDTVIDAYTKKYATEILTDMALAKGSHQKAADYRKEEKKYTKKLENIMAQGKPTVWIAKYRSDEKAAKNRRIVLPAIGIGTALAVIVLCGWYRRKKLKQKNEKALQHIEKIETEQKRQQVYLDKSSEMVRTTLQNAIAKLREEYKDNPEKLTTIRSHYVKQLGWDMPTAFLTQINTAYPGSIDKLRMRFPQLSEKDLARLALLVLQLSRREIAMLCQVKEDSISAYTSRLKTIMGLPKDADLHQMVAVDGSRNEQQ